MSAGLSTLPPDAGASNAIVMLLSSFFLGYRLAGLRRRGVGEGYRSVREGYRSSHNCPEVEIPTYGRDLAGYWR